VTVGDRSNVAALLLCAGLFGFAFVAAPSSCQWGLAAYFWAGVGTIAVLAALPVLRRDRRPPGRVAAAAVGHAALGAAVWVGAFALAPFRIICRLF